MDDRFAHDAYTIRRKVMTVAGAKFHVYDPQGQLVGFSKQKAFKLKEDIRLFTDESMEQELLTMQARSVVDFGATYDVFDPGANESVGSLRRKGLASMLRDSWLVFDPDGTEVAAVHEDSAGLAFLRRVHEIFSLIAPQAYRVEQQGRTVATYRQNRHPFVQKLAVEFSGDGNGLDRRLGLATGILLCAIEGRQD